jgi:hypothetical protein
MKKNIVTPGFRKKYLEILHNNLIKVKNEFDEWIIWANTDNKVDMEYMKFLEKKFNYIKLQHSEIKIGSIPFGLSLSHYWKKCVDIDTVYIRLDEDIVYIHPGSITNLYNSRIKNKTPFLVFGNIINNGIINFLYQKYNIIKNEPTVTYNCLDKISTHDFKFVEYLHSEFFKNYNNNNLDKFIIPDWQLSNFDRFSIGVFAAFGEELNKFGGVVDDSDDIGEEYWLSNTKPKQLNQPNIICGDTLFVHFAFHTQRNKLESNTNLLQQYKELSEKLIK